MMHPSHGGNWAPESQQNFAPLASDPAAGFNDTGKGKAKSWNTWQPANAPSKSWDSWDANKPAFPPQPPVPPAPARPHVWQSTTNQANQSFRGPTQFNQKGGFNQGGPNSGTAGTSPGPTSNAQFGNKGMPGQSAPSGNANQWPVKGPTGFAPGKGSTGPAVMTPAPRLPGFGGATGPQAKGGGCQGSVVAPPGKGTTLAPKAPVAPPVLDPKAAATTLGSALAAVATAAVRGAVLQPPSFHRPVQQFAGTIPGQFMPRGPVRPPSQPTTGFAAANAPMGVLHQFSQRPPTYGTPAHLGVLQPQFSQRPPTYGTPAHPAQLALANAPGLAPELAALVAAGQADSAGAAAPAQEKKPRIFLLLTRLSPDLQEAHMQQILEQCGEVNGWRRGRDSSGAPLSFGFAQFGAAEAAWKASTCLSKRVLCGQEIKVLVEEHAESLIQQWRSSQQAALKLASAEELEWELERKAVSCKALIDAKVEEIYGPQGSSGAISSAAAQRRQELRDRENARVQRTRKRKAWREAEFNKELTAVQMEEKRLRTGEKEKDQADRAEEDAELAEKAEQEKAIMKMEEAGLAPSAALLHPEGRKLVELVTRVQVESRADIFKMEIDVNFLRNEKILENKLRPWLESKIDLFMGGGQSDLVEYILRRVNANSTPESLISDLSRYLDDNTEALVERMWRMMGFELLCHGLAPDLLKKEKKLE